MVVARVMLPVTGMTCGGCAGAVQRRLARTAGVQTATVNLALETAEIEAEDAAAVVAATGAVRAAGYGVREEDLVLDLAAPGGDDRLGRAISAVPGVLACDFGPDPRRATLRLVGGTDMAPILAAADACGIAARPAPDQGDGAAEAGAAALLRAGRDRRDLSLAILLTLPFLGQMLAMLVQPGTHLPGILQLLLATPVQVWCARGFYAAAWRGLRAGAGNMDQLVVLGSSAAFIVSLALLLRHGEHAAHALYFEASATIVTLVLIGKALEARAKSSASAALRALMALSPQEARLLRAGAEVTVPLREVRPGDMVIVKPGERVPADGLVVKGEAELDESLLTGEPMPVLRRKGDAVVAGALNGAGLLRIRVERVGADTTLARIARIVDQAQSGRAPVQRLVDRVSAIFVPVVLGVALLTFGGWLLATGDAGRGFSAAVSVLVIACPCALGLATPAALVAGTGAAARAGILIRDVGVLERATGLATVVFDKTGTLTEGHPALAAMLPEDAEVLAQAASAQQGSEHPLARAFLAAAAAQGLTLTAPEGFAAHPGAGISARVGGAEVRVGRRDFVAGAEAAEPSGLREGAAAMAEAGQTVTWVSVDGRVAGAFGLRDTLRTDAGAAVRALTARGLSCVLLTGDGAVTAARVGAAVGITRILSGIGPEGKAAAIRDLASAGPVAMVGDGINDAPALAAADLGIAMGSGAELARESAGMILMRARPSLVPAALDIARATRARIRQNLFWAFAYNIICIPVAAAGLLSPGMAGAAMALSSLTVLANSLRLTRWQAEPSG